MGIKLILVWKFPAIAKREGIKSAISISFMIVVKLVVNIPFCEFYTMAF
jgi:hypothetical protein